MNVLGWGATTPPRPAPCWHCGHDRAVHQHHRPGTDCGKCGCPRYRPRRWWHPRPPAAVSGDQARTPPAWPDPPPGPLPPHDTPTGADLRQWEWELRT